MATSSLTSDPFFFVILSGLATCLVMAAIGSISLRRPGLGLMLFFVFFAFVWRLCSALYIDVLGPLFSEQLEREIGPGISAVPLALAQGMVIMALLWSLRPSRLEALFVKGAPEPFDRASGGGIELSSAAFWIATLFVAALWLELLDGPIPLFVGMERFDYARQFGGPLNHLLLEWGPMLAFQLGVFLVAPTFHGRPFDRRFAALFVCLILYLFLLGHRFSSLYAYTSFLVIPVGVALLDRCGYAQRTLFSGALLRKVSIAGVILCCLIVAAIAYSYVVVRGFEGAQLYEKLSQRVLVQQGEMWWITYERLFLRDDWNGAHAAYKLFIDPYDPSRNSTMQLLMESALPLPRAHVILDAGSAYTGGWPEVCFELGGPLGGFVLVAISALVFAEFMFLLARCIVEGRFATCLFLTPVLYALLINLVSGMVNSFIQLAFAFKIVTALLVYTAEEQWRSDRRSALRSVASVGLEKDS
jgi:hypothetical protein